MNAAPTPTYEQVILARNDGVCVNCGVNPSCEGIGEFARGWGEPDFCQTCNLNVAEELNTLGERGHRGE